MGMYLLKGKQKMKKILTLAIALVMVFAIAAPAFAAGWDKPTSTPTFDDLELNITALSVDEATSVWNGGTYNKLENTYPIVAGMRVHAYAEIEIPGRKSLRDDIEERIDAGQGKIKIGVTNLTNVELNVRNKDGLVIEDDTVGSDGTKSYPVNGPDIGTTITVEIWGNAVKSDKDAKITATLGVYNKWDGDQFSFFNKSGDEYTIFNGDADKFAVCAGDEWDEDNFVRFYVNSKGQVQMGQVMYKSKLYTIVDAYGEMNYAPENGGNLITGDIYRDVNAFLNDVLDAMGFEYGGRAYITRSLIMDNLGTVVEGSDSLVYPTGYVQQLVTSDPSVNPPQTGDNASVVGFVMIAVALVAAAAVTVKKVRA